MRSKERKEETLKKLFLLILISIGTLGCNGFSTKNLPLSFSFNSPPLAAEIFNPKLNQGKPNGVQKDCKDANPTPARLIEVSNPVEVEAQRKSDDAFLSDEFEFWQGHDLPCESFSSESFRFAEMEDSRVPSGGPAEKEVVAAENLFYGLDARIATPDENSWEKDPDHHLAGVVFSSADSREAEESFSRGPSLSVLATFPSLANHRVEGCIDFFRVEADSFFKRALGRSTTYEDMMKRIFREKNLPEELFYLALIESGFNPKAFSRAKASGIWQFIGKTAKRFGLKVDKWVDERRDPEKATHAAAEYLKSLYALFNDWDLATASYNAGEGKMMKAIKKANSQDFWKISQHRFLKKETKEYVPMFLAAVTIAQDPQKYGFRNIEYSPPLIYEKVTVPPATSLAVIAKAAGSDLSEIRALNPALKKGETPPHSSFEIKLPPEKKEVFKKNFSNIKKIPLKQKKHRVRKGENLVKIARKYRLPLQELCEENNLSPKNRIRPGTLLLIPSV